MRINLVFPPYWSFQAPYLALPALAGHLKQRGVTTRVLDLNVSAMDRMFSADFISECGSRIQRQLAVDPAAVDVNDVPIAHLFAASQVVLPRLDACKEVLRREWNPQRVGVARNVLDHAMEAVSAAFAPSNINRLHYSYRGSSIMDMALARKLSADESTNIFGALLGQRDVDEVLAGNPDVVGLSITGLHQLVPTLTLVDRLKASAPDVPIVLGGAITLYLYELALRRPELFDGVDFLVVGEGETALAHLLEALAGTRPMGSVENLIYRRNGRFEVGKMGHAEDVGELGPPDFEDTAWETYLSPTRIVPYLTSRGCYWDKCAFCSLCATYLNTYRERKIDKVIDDLRHLSMTGDAGTCFFFTDECFSPRRLRTISRALLDADLKLEWDILARFEKPFKSSDFALAAEAGLNWITWGLESASPKMLKRMGKGIQPEVAGRLLRDVDEVGIWNNIFVFFGFPGETDEDYQQTKSFVRRNMEHIDSLAYAEFRLEKGAAIYKHWEEFGITLADTPETYIGPAFPFEYGPPPDAAGTPSTRTPRWLIERLADFEAFLQLETSYSRVLAEGMSPANLKAALHRLGGKTEVVRLIDKRAGFFRAVFCQMDWHVEGRFRLGPYSQHQPNAGFDGDEVLLFSESSGKILTINRSGRLLLENLATGLTLREVLEKLQGAAPSEADILGTLPFVQWMLWRRLLEPVEGGALPPYPTLGEPDPASLSEWHWD